MRGRETGPFHKPPMEHDMKVILIEPRATASGPQNAGDEIDVSDAEAKRLIQNGTARPVRATKKNKPEKAVKDR